MRAGQTLRAVLPLVALLALADATAATPFKKPTPEVQRLFQLAALRALEANGVAEVYTHAVDPPEGKLPENQPDAVVARFAREEAERAAAYDAVFGAGSYARLDALDRDCYSKDHCDKLMVTGLIEVSYLLVAVAHDAAAQPGLDAAARRATVIAGLAHYLEPLRPGKGLDAAHTAERIAALEPVLARAFTTEQRAEFAQRAAAESDVAPAYDLLARTRAAGGDAAGARAAYPKALARDPADPEARQALGRP